MQHKILVKYLHTRKGKWNITNQSMSLTLTLSQSRLMLHMIMSHIKNQIHRTK